MLDRLAGGAGGGEHGVVELPPDFQVGAYACGLPGLHHQGQFEQKRRRLRFGGVLCCGCFLLPMGLTCLYT